MALKNDLIVLAITILGRLLTLNYTITPAMKRLDLLVWIRYVRFGHFLKSKLRVSNQDSIVTKVHCQCLVFSRATLMYRRNSIF